MDDIPNHKQRRELVTKSALPAEFSGPDKFKLFSKLCRLADAIIEAYDLLRELAAELYNRKLGEALPDGADLSKRELRQLQQARELIELLDRRDYYDEGEDDDGDKKFVLKRDVIKRRLAITVGSKLTSDNVNMDVFARELVNHVWDAEPTYLELESACRQIEADANKWSPLIGPVLSILAEQRKVWRKRIDAIDDIETLSASLTQKIRELESKIDNEARVIAYKARSDANVRCNRAQTELAKASADWEAKQNAARVASQEAQQACDRTLKAEASCIQAVREFVKANGVLFELEAYLKGLTTRPPEELTP